MRCRVGFGGYVESTFALRAAVDKRATGIEPV